MIEQRICIVGLGLMGGSLALALRPYCRHLTAVDPNPQTRQLAQKHVDLVTADLATGLAQADLVILATPVQVVEQLLAQLPQLRPDGCMVLDLGSTKADICRQMAALPETFQAMGGHPMCGKETSGFAAATATLFRKQTFVLCRNGRTTPAIEDLAFEIVTTIGAQPLYLEPDKHDAIVALVSHLPYLVAAVLMGQTADAASSDDNVWPISSSGLRDTTRLAGSDPRMMLDILLTNREMVLVALAEYQNRLADVQTLLAAGNDRALAAWLQQRQLNRQVYVMQKDKGSG